MTAGPFRRVLVGWDASADAVEALNAAAAIAGAGGHVVALAVVRQTGHVGADEEDTELASIRLGAEEHFERLRGADPAVAGIRMSLRVVADTQVGRAVCDYAAEHGFDLLVLGRHGDKGGLRTRLGRVAEAAAQACAVPVLLLSAP